MRDKILHYFVACLDFLGINDLCRFLNRNKGIILWYHGTRPDDYVPSNIYGDMHLPVSVFRKQINYLQQKGYSFVSLSDLIYRCRHKLPIQKLVTLTFDDGYASVVELVYPIMKEQNAKGCLYVVSDAVNKNELLWPDRVAVSVDNTPGGRFIFNCNGEALVYTLGDRASYRNTVSDIIRRMRLLPDVLRHETSEQFPNHSDFPSLLRILSLKQLQSLEREVIEIGSHTRSHSECTRLISESDFESALDGSKSALEKMAGYEINNFCYPSGAYSDNLPAHLAKYGYLTAVTTAPGFVDNDSDFFKLKRLNAAADFSLFKAMVSGSVHGLLQLNYFLRNNRGYRK